MKTIGLIAVLMLALGSQARADSWDGDALMGGAIGGAAGAAIGSALGGRDAAIVGGLLGGATGVAVATRDDYYRRPAPVHYRPEPPVYYRPAPVQRVYERYEYGPPPGHRHFRHYEPRRDYDYGHDRHRHGHRHHHRHHDW